MKSWDFPKYSTKKVFMEDSILTNRFKDLANRSFQGNRFTYSNFLSLADQSELLAKERELSFAGLTLFGGNEWCERKVVRFGNPQEFGYDEDFPIACLEIAPLNEKFSDDLTHRDFLGALMNLGIEREVLGDIFVDRNRAVLYCLESMSSYICENLSKVRHTSIVVKPFTGEFVYPEEKKEALTIQVSSERVDAVIARVYKLSRDSSIDLFREQKVFINGRLQTGNDTKVKEGDRISVRGFGRFDVCENAGVSRKGKLNVKVLVYK